MTSRYESNAEVPGRLSTGYEGESSDSDFIPSLKIEDVDRAFFELFQSSLPLFYRSSKNSDGEQKRIPVIFSTGERFAIATKKEPVRDKNGALILPLISITRSGISQENSKGGGINDRQNELIIKRKISKEDPLYQSTQKTSNDFFESSGRVFYPRLEKGIYETIVIPMPKYFTLSYEVTIWTQYLQQMNDVMQVMMGSYLQPGARNIKINTKQGYWLVAYFGDEVSQDSNVSDFSDSERLLKASFTASVPAYLILPEFPGSMKPIKKFISAPEITFNSVPKQEIEDIPGPGIPPGNIDAYLLSEVSTIDDPDFPDSIGVSGKVQSKRLTGDITNTIPQYPLGSRKTSKQETEIFELNQDPYTGEKKRIRVKKTRTNSQGESVLLASEFNSKKK
jgi:hypothetical protein